MHACGHDAHAAMAAVAAMALWQNRDRLPDVLAWRAIFQPSEEIGEGAFEMIDAGAMQGVKAIIALHVDPTLAAGKIGYRHGVLTAHCQEIEVEINGRGGHAARPHQSIDPISVASQFITSVYQFVPRSVDSRDPVVLTFGSIQGGTSANIIPENVTLKGTIRTLSEASTIAVGEQLKKLADGLSMASGATVRIESRHGTDAVVNDPEVTRACIRAAGEVAGQNHLIEIPLPSMGGEDFSGYLKHAPGCLLRLGAGVPDQPNQFLHSPHFDIDERSLAIGAKLLAHGVVLVSESIKLR
jgi:amidohydrolase